MKKLPLSRVFTVYILAVVSSKISSFVIFCHFMATHAKIDRVYLCIGNALNFILKRQVIEQDKSKLVPPQIIPHHPVYTVFLLESPYLKHP